MSLEFTVFRDNGSRIFFKKIIYFYLFMAVLDLSAVGFSLAAVSGGCSIAVASH